MNLSRPSAGPLARTVAVIAAVAGFTIATPLLAATSRTTVPLVVAPRAKPTERAIQLVAVGMQVEVAGTLATTRVELAFLNPNTRQLEGELQFPLGDEILIWSGSVVGYIKATTVTASGTPNALAYISFEE